jgi:proline iminopeptidase
MNIKNIKNITNIKNIKNIVIIILVIIILYYIFNYLYSYFNDIYFNTALYPKISPLNTYYIKVSEIHTVSYSTYGNINGKPVLFVHGGPGGGTTDTSARFFNPKYYYIILVDQRGCGKSIPSGELKENTTQNLIEDFEKIRKELNIDKWLLFGGSWGSTLSLAYAITYPEIVSGMILRGIFLSTPEEIEWIYGSDDLKNVSKFTPIAWNYFVNTLPKENDKFNNNYIEKYKKCFNGDFGKEKREECLLSWNALGGSITQLQPKTLDEVITELKNKKKYVEEGSLIENNYLLHNCFLEPGFFFKKENVEKIKNIPSIIVQGQYDLMCPLKTAYKLHDILENSKIYVTFAGHTGYDYENIKYLVKATDFFLNPNPNPNSIPN